MKHFKSILGVTAAFLTAATLQAQTYNDSVRTRSWSVYVQGGISGHHGVRSNLFDNSKRTIAPDISLGVKYNLKPWVRIGMNAGYTMLRSTDKNILSVTTTNNNYLIDGKAATLETQSDRLQNQNNAHLLGLDANVDFNILDIWHNRKAQWLNLYAGAGLGYIHGWNRNSQTWSFNEMATAVGDDHYNVYIHAYMKSAGSKKQFDALYIPLSLSLEFDVQRQLTVGIIGQYKYMPLKVDFSPKGIYSAGIVVRYNLVKSKSKLQQKQMADLYAQYDASRAECVNGIAVLQRESDKKTDRINDLERQVEEMKSTVAQKEVVAKEKVKSVIVYFGNDSWELSAENTELLNRFAEQLKANPEARITIVGSANAVGHAGGNRKLSDNRLGAVKQYLGGQGISEARFTSEVSLGDQGMTADPDCRRVIVVAQP